MEMMTQQMGGVDQLEAAVADIGSRPAISGKEKVVRVVIVIVDMSSILLLK